MNGSRRLALVAAWGLIAYLAVLVGTRSDEHQWDFESYYVSAKAFAKGANPYDNEARVAAAGRYAKYPFAYPPLVLYLFRPLIALPYEAAFLVWLLLKLAGLALLIRVWDRHFGPVPAAPTVLLLLVLAFNGTLFLDLIAGNLSILEQLGVWIALAALLQGRDVIFAVALGVSAQIKLLPALLIPVALLIPPRPRWRAFVLASLCFLALLSLNFFHRELLPDFLSRTQALGSGGPGDPSSYSFFTMLKPYLGDARGLDGRLYAVFVVALGSFTARALIRLRARPEPDARLAVLLLASAYALALPRLKGYAYVVLIPPALHVVRSARVKVPLAAVLIALPLRASFLPFTEYVRLAYLFLPWIAALYVFYELCREAASPQPVLPTDA